MLFNNVQKLALLFFWTTCTATPQPCRVYSQLKRLAGICSSRGADEYSEAQLPRGSSETRTPTSLVFTSTHMHFPPLFFWSGGVGPALHRCDPLRPVKGSTQHSGLWSGREKEQLHKSEKAKAQLSPGRRANRDSSGHCSRAGLRNKQTAQLLRDLLLVARAKTDIIKWHNERHALIPKLMINGYFFLCLGWRHNFMQSDNV